MICKGCGLDHPGWIGCLKARYEADKAAKSGGSQPETVVVHVDTGGSQSDAVVVHTRHGRHLNTEARKAYRREWMRKRRASV